VNDSGRRWSYTDSPIFEHFQDIADLARYVDVPDDWHVLVADVEGSTAAIRAGRYKDVNLIGVSAIAAIVNAVRPTIVPFVFGGDGATFCVPPESLAAAHLSLAAVANMSRTAFQLDLRIGSVPVADIRSAGRRTLVARHRVSSNYIQAVFAGGGLRYAEKMVKDRDAGASYRIADADTGAPDCSGLECRWNEIPSPFGETVALLIQATAGDDQRDAVVYRDACAAIEASYGVEENSHPVTEKNLRLTHGRGLAGETLVRTHARSAGFRFLYALGLRVQVLLGRFFFATKARIAGTDFGAYKNQVVANTDRRKFDDTLRIVLAGSAGQRRSLEAWLVERHRRGELAYGLHVADAALMTCLIGNRESGDHLHFVDAAGGGYALAAVDLKRRLAKA
jgi:hypothetical protein